MPHPPNSHTKTPTTIKVSPEKMYIPSTEELLTTPLVIEIENHAEKPLKGRLQARFPQNVRGKLYTAYPARKLEFHEEYAEEYEIEPRKTRWYEFYPIYTGADKETAGKIELSITAGDLRYRKTIPAVMYKTPQHAPNPRPKRKPAP